MNFSEYVQHDAVALAALVRQKQVSASELAEVALRAIDSVQGRLNAVAETWPPEAEDLARSSGDFAGVPFLIKDLGVLMKGRKVEFGSRLVQGMEAPFDSYLMARFRRAGLVTIGRTVTPELGFSSTTEPTFHGVVRNPWDPLRTAGGSSGGSAAAVACGAVPLAHGTDGGGSLRIPASFCGLFALKPSRGRTSNGPLLDEIFNGLAVQLGLSRSVRDSAVLLDAIQGEEPGDPYAAAPPTRPYAREAATDPEPLRIGLQLDAPNGRTPDSEIADCAREAARLCERLGHRVTEAVMPIGATWDAFLHANSVIWTANLASSINDLSGLLGRKPSSENLERSTWGCYQSGLKLSADEFVRALGMRNTFARASAAFFKDFDIVMTPTMPSVAQAIGSYEHNIETYDGPGWTRLIFEHTPYTALFNVTGMPAMSVPLGVGASSGLPVGIQFGAALGREDVLFRLAGQLERAAPWRDRKPQTWIGRAP